MVSSAVQKLLNLISFISLFSPFFCLKKQIQKNTATIYVERMFYFLF